MALRPLLVLLLGLTAFPAAAAAAPSDPVGGAAAPPVWSAAASLRQPGKAVETRPAKFRAYALDRASLRAQLAGAPLEHTGATRRERPVVEVAGPDGVERFRVVESPIMEAALAARHPEIRTYAGRGVDDPKSSIRLDVSPLGFHASVRSRDGDWYVDPYYRDDQGTYVAYYGRDLTNVHGPRMETPPPGMEALAEPAPAAKAPGQTVVQRVYRLALASDPTYTTYFGAANVTAAKVTLINRVNQLYNDDLAVKMVLIAGNDKLNLDTEAEYRNAGGPCGVSCYPPGTGDACDVETITQNNVAISGAVGPTSYDIGHLVLGKPGGGVAFLGVVGDPAQKAGGCTGVPTPKGDFFAVDYVAHEMGHQFAGNHTFNGNQHNCSGGNRNASTSVEPGSGSTVMAYAGICRQDDLQPHSDPYFSQRSIDEIETYITSGNEEPGSTHQGFEQIATANESPIVTAPPARTIPVRTPFTLSGTATDPDGNAMVYLWEQNDPGARSGVALVNNDKPSGPLFRVFGRYGAISEEATLLSPSPGQNIATSADATRTFPDPVQIAAGNTNAATGTCPTVAPPSPDSAPPPVAVPIVECYSEFLPTTARTLRFRLTARDLAATGGGISNAETLVTVAGTAPFLMTSQTAPSSANGNDSVAVTWNVAGTSAAPFNAPNVRISYSTDGGLTFPTVLTASTPNDGLHPVTVPNVSTSAGRFKVEAVDNYFFDVSRGNLTVTPTVAGEPTTEPGTEPTAEPTAVPTAEPTPQPTPEEPPRLPPVTTAPSASGVAVLRPDLSRLSRRLRVKGASRLRLPVRCLASGSTPLTARCKGVVRIFAKVGGRQRVVARRSFDIARGTTRSVSVGLRSRELRRLRTRSLPVTVKAKLASRGSRTYSKKVRILRRRR